MEVLQRESGKSQSMPPGAWVGMFRTYGWKIAGISIAAGLVTFAVMLLQPNLYRASATITPAVDESKPPPALGALGALGIQVGAPSKVEDLESLFKSKDLTVRVFSKNDLWTVVFPGRYDPESKALKPRLVDRVLRQSKAGPPRE